MYVYEENIGLSLFMCVFLTSNSGLDSVTFYSCRVVLSLARGGLCTSGWRSDSRQARTPPREGRAPDLDLMK